MTIPHVLIAGLGPAGLALAAGCARRGLDIRAVDPRPERTWTATYGLWEPEWRAAVEAFPALSGVATRTTRSPAVVAPRRDGSPAHGLVDLPYVVVDPAGLQRALLSYCPSIVTSEAAPTTAELRALRAEDGTIAVVDCRGAEPVGRPAPRRESPAQSAFGIVVADVEAERFLAGTLSGGAEAGTNADGSGGSGGILMDWRAPVAAAGGPGGVVVGAAARRRRSRRRSFLYAVRLPGGETLLEETDLAGAPAMGSPELRDRLADRLGLDRGGLAEVARRGHGSVGAAEGGRRPAIEVLRTEHVRFPLLAARRSPGTVRIGTTLIGATRNADLGPERFGVAAGFGHPATGYSIATTLLAADGAAADLADGRKLRSPVPRGTDILHRAGLRALLSISPDALADMFAAFGQMDVRRQEAFFSRTRGPAATTAAMGTQWAKAAATTRIEVAAAAFGARLRGASRAEGS